MELDIYPGASLGVRAFRIEEEGRFFKDYTIKSVSSDKGWTTNKEKAFCLDGFSVTIMPFWSFNDYENHPETPDKNCKCGFYAYKSFGLFDEHYNSWGVAWVAKHGGERSLKPDQIPALIAQWGKVIETEYGVRSQYAKIIALVGNDKRLKKIAKQYDLPLVFPADIDEFAYEMGLEVLPVAEEEKIFGTYLDYSRCYMPQNFEFITALMNRTYFGMLSKNGKSIYSIDGNKLEHVRIVGDIFKEHYGSCKITNEGVKYEFPCLPWESKDDELYYYESYDHFMRQIDALFERNNPEELETYRVKKENEKI